MRAALRTRKNYLNVNATTSPRPAGVEVIPGVLSITCIPMAVRG
jgi:hypothetical protein